MHNNLLKYGDQSWRLYDLVSNFYHGRPERFAEFVLPLGRIAIVSTSPLDLVAAAVWLRQSNSDGIILDTARLAHPVADYLLSNGYRIWSINDIQKGCTVIPAFTEEKRRAGTVGILTSGTTGAPKLIHHTWNTLVTAPDTLQEPRTWLLTYQPGTYAWWQMVTLWMFSKDQALVVPSDPNSLSTMLSAPDQGVDAISSTPTFWRTLFMQMTREGLQKIKLKQITLGGEAVDQTILNRLRALYPESRLTHIYASTEAGACIVVSDGREGFPEEWLAKGDRFRLVDGVLHLRSRYAAPGQEEWINTGDEARVWGDRVVVIGRKGSATINVGGAKFSRMAIEEVVQTHPGVIWCRAYGKPSPLTGEIVCADVVLQGDLEEAALVQYCQSKLAEYAIPRIWRRLYSIPVGGNFKGEVR